MSCPFSPRRFAVFLFLFFLMFRKHQDEFGLLCHDIRTQIVPNPRQIICSVTPGGGKSLLPLIAASQLLGSLAERICWVVPRRALQQQAESEFLSTRGREMLGHNYLIRRASNEPDPCRGLAGFVTTYQAIGMGNYYLKEEFAHRRYILFLDEPHHVEEGGAWEIALAPLVQRAALTVFMSGTLERGNRKRIAFLPYASSSQGEKIDFSGRQTPVIEYSRRDALGDKAVLPIHFELMDGTAQWIGRDGATYSTTLSTANKDTSEALYTALKTQFAVQLLDECVSHWVEWKNAHPRAKLLVVTANIEDAKKYVAHLSQAGFRAAIATSDDSAQAQANIDSFKLFGGVGRKKPVDVLVTVAMAYEGLDVPAVTHIACLTHIRSKPWIEQMIARATRFDAEAGAWEEQIAHIYVPDDKNICAIIDAMQHEQVSAIKTPKGDGEWDEYSDEEMAAMMDVERTTPEERNAIVPVGSEGKGRRWNRVGHIAPSTSSTQSAPTRTPSQQEAALREKIQKLCRQIDWNRFESKWGETNKRVVTYFGKQRTQMTLAELERVREWLAENYPV